MIIGVLAHRSVKRERIDALTAGFIMARGEYGITTIEREAMFWAQMAHETGGFRWLSELGGPSYFRRYDGRRDLGNTEPGDGYRFKGRGLIHLTGRHNYRKFGKRIGIDLENNPKAASEPPIAIKLAMEYWKDRNLNKWADKKDVRKVTRLINGGYNGLADRQKYYNIAIKMEVTNDEE